MFAIWQLSPASASSAPPSSRSFPSNFIIYDSLIPSAVASTYHSFEARLSPLKGLSPASPLSTIFLFFFLSISRLGLWTLDLSTQEITQTRVPPETCSSFAGTERAFIALCELGQWIFAAILSKPGQFKWLAAGSLCAVGTAAGAYAGWVRGRRGHLIHLEAFRKSHGC